MGQLARLAATFVWLAWIPVTTALAAIEEVPVQIDPTTGQALFRLPLVVPPGPADSGPRPALRYASGRSRRASWLGLGWSLDGTSLIERDRRHGPPLERASSCGGSPCFRESFVLDGEPLVCRDSACDGRFRTQEDRGLRIRRLASGFEVVERDGRIRRYGARPDSRVLSPSNGQVFRWLLDRVEDVHGNWTEYDYDAGTGVRYLRSIRWAQAGAAANRSLLFEREPSPEPSIDLSAGFRRVHDQRLRRIEVRAAGDAEVGAYELRYTRNAESGRSLLARVWRETPDGQAGPSHDFSYTQSVRSFSAEPVAFCEGSCPSADVHVPGPHGVWESTPHYTFVDLDRDARVDLHAVFRYPEGEDPGGSSWIYAGPPERFGPLELWSADFVPSVELSFNRRSVVRGLIDVDGDGYPDAFPAMGTGSSAATAAYRRGGPDGLQDPLLAVAGFRGALRIRVDGPVAERFEVEQRLFDLTGDGLPDYVVAGDGRDDPPGYPDLGPWQVYRNLGASEDGLAFATEPELWTDPFAGAIEAGTVRDGLHTRWSERTLDANGDGLPDRLLLDEQGVHVAYNDGAGFGPPQLLLARDDTPLAIEGLRFDQGTCQTLDWVDLNADGLLDLVFARWSRAYPVTHQSNRDPWQVLYGTGSGLQSEPVPFEVPGEDEGANATCVRGRPPYSSGLVDVDADGLLDHHGRQFHDLFPQQGPVPDLLERVRLPTGTEVALVWASSAELVDSTGRAASPGLGRALQVVIERHVRPANDLVGERRTTYHYAGAELDPRDRQLPRFRRQREREVDSGAQVETSFASQPACAGRVALREVYDDAEGGGALLRRQRHGYRVVPLPLGAAACLLETSRVESVEGDLASSRVAETRFDHGPDPAASHYRVLRVEERGEIDGASGEDVEGDERVERYTFATPDDPWRGPLDAVESLTQEDGSGNALARTVWVYDALPVGRVSRGSPTLEARWLADPTRGIARWVLRRSGYDRFGQPTLFRGPGTPDDPDGLLMTRDYDPVYQTFPTRDVFAADSVAPFETAYHHDGCRAGEAPPPALGRICRQVDRAGRVTLFGYDGFGRRTFARHPSGLEETSRHEIQDGAHVTTVEQRVGGALLLGSEGVDDAGRVLFREEPGRARERVRRAWRYDGRGRLDAELLPHFAGDAPAVRRLRHDALGRLRARIEPDGETRHVVTRAPWVETEEVRSGAPGAALLLRRVRHGRDARGRIVRSDFWPDPHVESGALTVLRERDALGRLRRVLDPVAVDAGLCAGLDPACATQAHRIELIHDSLGRRVEILDPDRGRTRMTYDDAGRLVERSDAAGRTVRQRWDDRGRLVERTHEPSGRGVDDLQFVYQDSEGLPGFGELAAVQSLGAEPGRIEFGYDFAGRRSRIRQQSAGLDLERQSAFDALDREVQRRAPNGETYGFHYDGRRLGAITAPGLYVLVGARYDAYGRPTRIQVGSESRPRVGPAALTLVEQLDPSLRRLRLSASGRIDRNALRLDVEFDGLGAPVYERLRRGRRSELARRYAYDGLGRLVSAHGPFETGEGAVEWSYVYDALGNLRSRSSSSGRTPERFAYRDPRSPRALTEHVHAAGEDAYGWDAAGFPDQRNGLPFHFGADGSLHRPPEADVAYHYLATPEGSWRAVEREGDATRVRLLDDYEHDLASGETAQHFRVAGRWIASLVQRPGGGRELYAYVTDHQGTLHAVLSSRGETLHALRYAPYGAVLEERGSSPARWRYNGRRVSRGGRLDYGARVYDPRLRRFVSPDPVIPEWSPTGLNRYAYALGAPGRYVDPSGHLPVPVLPARYPFAARPAPSAAELARLERGFRVLQTGGVLLIFVPHPAPRAVGGLMVLVADLGRWAIEEQRLAQQPVIPPAPAPPTTLASFRLPMFAIGHFVYFW